MDWLFLVNALPPRIEAAVLVVQEVNKGESLEARGSEVILQAQIQFYPGVVDVFCFFLWLFLIF